MAERIVVFCRTCNALIEVSNQGLGRASIAAWLTNHQDHDIERTNTTAETPVADEYTPTTERVRDSWVYANTGGESVRTYQEAADLFNLWLEAHDAEVRNDATEHALLVHTNLSAEEIGTILGYPHKKEDS